MTKLQPAATNIALGDGTMLICQQMVRHVPGKRMVCRASWQQQEVYAKIFSGTHAARHAAREKSGWALLTQAGILTPPLLHDASLADGSGQALLYAAIAATGNAEDDWRALAQDGEGRLALMLALTRTVAVHHQAGLLQADLYLKNFLVHDGRIYTLDCDGIRRLGPFFKQHQTLHNLALLLSKMDVTDDGWIAQLYNAYCQQRGWAGNLAESASLQRMVPRIRRETVSAYADRKIFRNCSDVVVKRSCTRFLAMASAWSAALLPEANRPDAWLAEQRGQRLKSGNTCTLSLVEIGGKRVVVKRYNLKNFWHGLNRALRPTRASACWANAHRLRMVGIAAAAPIALLERRCGPFRRQAYFLAEYIDAPDAVEFFADAAVPPSLKASAAEAVASLFCKLYLLKIEHGDFKATNMKIVNGNPLLLDLDSMRQRHCNWLYVRRHARDLRRFMRNWQQDQAISDLLTAALRHAYADTRPLRSAGMH